MRIRPSSSVCWMRSARFTGAVWASLAIPFSPFLPIADSSFRHVFYGRMKPVSGAAFQVDKYAADRAGSAGVNVRGLRCHGVQQAILPAAPRHGFDLDGGGIGG